MATDTSAEAEWTVLASTRHNHFRMRENLSGTITFIAADRLRDALTRGVYVVQDPPADRNAD